MTKKNAKFTQWFSVHTPPIRHGVYERRVFSDSVVSFFQFWNGQFWGLVDKSPELAAEYWARNRRSPFSRGEWRGLAKKP